jgi:hypothetical protein
MLSTSLFLLATLLSRHTPHAEASGVAIAKRADGRTEIVLASRAETRVLRSFDSGQSWELVAGDGLERSSPTRVVYYPQGGSRFLIATREGAWCYWNELETVQNISTGIPEADRYLIDLVAPDPGSDGPAMALSNTGKVFLFDAVTDQWQQVLDTTQVTSIGGLAITPDFDSRSALESQHTLYVGHGRGLFQSVDLGLNWTSRTDLVADPGGDFHFSALSLAKDYAQSGVVLAGLGRDSLAYTGTAGRLLRSKNFGVQFQTIPVEGIDPLGAEITRIMAAPATANGSLRFYMALHYFPDLTNFPNDPGILISADQGKTWSDFGNRQDFAEDGSANAGTGVGRNNLWMNDLAYGPDFQLDGQIWLARGEGVYRSNDHGLHWTRRQIRPATQVRGISAGLAGNGQTIVAAATYGSSIIKYWPGTGKTQLAVDPAMIYGEPSVSSPNFDLDGSFVVGGRNDVAVGFQTPLNVGIQHWFSVNELRQVTDGSTGYVREIAVSPNFSLLKRAGFDRTFAWAANRPHSTIGDSRATFDGLTNVYFLDQLANPLGDPAPRMFDLQFASGYTEGNLPPVMDFFGCSKTYEQIYFLRNLGSMAAPDLKWQNLAFVPGGPVTNLAIDPDFSRPNNPVIWALVDCDTIVRLEDLSTDWSNISEQRLPVLTDLEITDFEVVAGPPNQPTIYALSYGEGVLKLDMSQQTLQWQAVGGAYPKVAASSMAIDPNFAQTKRIFVGSHDGIVTGVDQLGVAWQEVQQPSLHDEANQGFDFFSPLDPLNPDPSRPWGWDRIPRVSINSIDVLGNFIAFTQTDEAYVRFDLEATRVDILTVEGPIMADCRIEVYDYDTGILIKTVWRGLQSTQVKNRRVRVVLPQKRRVELRVYAVADQPGETFYFDGLLKLD